MTRCLSKEPDGRPTAAEVLDWCAARAAERPWWERPEVTALIEDHEEAVAPDRRVGRGRRGGHHPHRPAAAPASSRGSVAQTRVRVGGRRRHDRRWGDGGDRPLGNRPGTRRQPVTPSWRSGTPLWTREVGALEYGGTLTRTADALYVRFDGTARRLDPHTGA
ncbi:hypothetical protein [Streptomyces sp. NPDC050988]|uniref:hypothetical protein n=1 Tax=Streptomyces sp. NPDC050988 TaxID=3365637 RepID=UPI0037B21CC5